jgi:heat shock protein HslJ
MIARWCASSWLLVLLGMFSTGTRAQEQSQGAVSDLSGPTWQLVQFQSSDGKTLVTAHKGDYTIAFNADGSVAVRVDCNRGRSTWKSAQHNQIELGPLALTRMACPPSSLNDCFTKDWQHVRSYLLKAGHLFLALMADGGIYEYEQESSSSASPVGDDSTHPGGAASMPPVENTYWKLTRLGGTAVTMASKEQEPHIILNPQLRRVAGSGGCNRITGSYETNGDRLSFSQMAGTMMACIEGMETEKAFLDALNHVDKWKITGRELELYDATGSPIASLEARYVK